MAWGWSHWVTLLVVFFVAVWIGSKYPQTNLLAKVTG